MTKSTKDSRAKMGSRTRLVHAGRTPFENHGFVNTPIYRGSTVLYPNTEELNLRRVKYTYGTHGTPTTDSLETAWSELCGAAGTILSPSGLAAIAVALLSIAKAGGHLLVTDSAYRPTRNFCNTVLKRLGVETTYYVPEIGAGIEKLIQPNTIGVIVEAPGSQSFEMQDIPAIAAAAHARDVCVVMDNTWATPLFFPPHERGVDLAIEAGTKYLSGHSDLLLGLVSANEKYWPQLKATHDAMASCAGPEDVFLALRGLRTMELRLREAERQGLALARWLEEPAGSVAGPAPRPARLPGPRHLETRFPRVVRPVLHRPEAGLAGAGRSPARQPRTVRPRLFLGRLRKPGRAVRLQDLSDSDRMGAGRPGAAFFGRPREYRRPADRSRKGVFGDEEGGLRRQGAA